MSNAETLSAWLTFEGIRWEREWSVLEQAGCVWTKKPVQN